MSSAGWPLERLAFTPLSMAQTNKKWTMFLFSENYIYRHVIKKNQLWCIDVAEFTLFSLWFVSAILPACWTLLFSSLSLHRVLLPYMHTHIHTAFPSFFLQSFLPSFLAHPSTLTLSPPPWETQHSVTVVVLPGSCGGDSGSSTQGLE